MPILPPGADWVGLTDRPGLVFDSQATGDVAGPGRARVWRRGHLGYRPGGAHSLSHEVTSVLAPQQMPA